jgi:hypothetical protein
MAAPKTVFFKKSELPATARVGQTSTKPVLAIGDNGQISFNSFLTKAFDGAKYIGVGTVNAEKRRFAIQGFKELPKGMKAEDLFTPSRNAKSKTIYFGAAPLLTLMKYEYSKSGRQIRTEDKDKGEMKFFPEDMAVVVTIPEGALTPPPVDPNRKPRGANKATANGTAAAAAAGANGSGSTVDGPDNDDGADIEAEDDSAEE